MSVTLQTVMLLALSNVFMTIAWYWHLRGLNDKPWHLAALASWGIALFEYLIQVPANRIGHTQFNMSQLKILQEVVSLSVFVPVAILVLREPLRWDYLWAALCIVGAVFFMFRGKPEVPATPAPQVESAPLIVPATVAPSEATVSVAAVAPTQPVQIAAFEPAIVPDAVVSPDLR